MKFYERYPQIYSEFQNLIERRNSSKEFIMTLNHIYEAIDNRNSALINQYWTKLFSNKVVNKHPFFKLLLYYLPLPINILPPYLAALQSALSNTNIIYENRTNKMKALVAKNSFRGTCIELILSDILQKQGYHVTILGESNQKHPDIVVKLNGLTANIEVSQREYKVNPHHPEKTLTRKLVKEGKQLKNEVGYNIIVLFFDNVLNLGNQILPNEIYTCFRVIDSLYYYKAGKKYFILDTHKNLSHVSAVGFLLNGQTPLDYFGQASGMFVFRTKENIPEQILSLLKSIRL